MKNEIANYYDESYFVKQSAAGEVQGVLNSWKFDSFIDQNDTILDFGCGSGALLRVLGSDSNAKFGIEINEFAAAYARERGTNVYSAIDTIEAESINVVISNHALEHVPNPHYVVSEFFRVAKPGGLCIVVVPCDSPNLAYSTNDFDKHLYSWSANNLGNLMSAVGFEVVEAGELRHRWPPKWNLIYSILGIKAFNFVSRFYSFINRSRMQVRVVARKPIQT